MLLVACLFVAGVVALESEPMLPDAMWCGSLPVAVQLMIMKARASPLCALVAGYSWAAFVAHMQMGASLPAVVEGRDVEITGTVRGLPQADLRRSRFDFHVRDSSHADLTGARVRLSWYRVRAAPAPGSVWRLKVRLRRPRGWRNPGGSDYEGWLFANRIVATGYVKDGEIVGSAPRVSLARIDAVRAGLALSIRSALDGYGSEGLVRALAIGDRSGVSERHWRTLRVTGIAHLMAISGLHIGMAAGAAYWVALRAWTLVPRAALLIAAPQVAGLAAMLAAFGYALLAGLALPTQRALLMLGVVFGSRLARRYIPSSNSLALALVAILVVDPHRVRAAGFWLSFVAVAVIVMALATRPAASLHTFSGRLRTMATAQFAVTVGLAPVTLSVFAEQSIVSPLVNAFVIPLVGVIVVPVILLGLLAGVVHPGAGAAMLGGAALVLDTLWPAVEWIAAHAVMLAAPGEIGMWQIAAAAVGGTDRARAAGSDDPLARLRLDAADDRDASGAHRSRGLPDDGARRGARTFGGGGNGTARARLRHGAAGGTARCRRSRGTAVSRTAWPRHGRSRGAEPWRHGPRRGIRAPRQVGRNRVDGRERSGGFT